MKTHTLSGLCSPVQRSDTRPAFLPPPPGLGVDVSELLIQKPIPKRRGPGYIYRWPDPGRGRCRGEEELNKNLLPIRGSGGGGGWQPPLHPPGDSRFERLASDQRTCGNAGEVCANLSAAKTSRALSRLVVVISAPSTAASMGRDRRSDARRAAIDSGRYDPVDALRPLISGWKEKYIDLTGGQTICLASCWVGVEQRWTDRTGRAGGDASC